MVFMYNVHYHCLIFTENGNVLTYFTKTAQKQILSKYVNWFNTKIVHTFNKLSHLSYLSFTLVFGVGTCTETDERTWQHSFFHFFHLFVNSWKIKGTNIIWYDIHEHITYRICWVRTPPSSETNMFPTMFVSDDSQLADCGSICCVMNWRQKSVKHDVIT